MSDDIKVLVKREVRLERVLQEFNNDFEAKQELHHIQNLIKRECLRSMLEFHYSDKLQNITLDELIKTTTALSDVNRKIECYETRQTHTPEKYASEIEFPRGGSFSYRSRW